MGKFKFIETGIDDLFIIESQRFGDARGYFMETYNEKDFHDAGLDVYKRQDLQIASHLIIIKVCKWP